MLFWYSKTNQIHIRGHVYRSSYPEKRLLEISLSLNRHFNTQSYLIHVTLLYSFTYTNDSVIDIWFVSCAGIGKETALELARRGAKIIMACRNLEQANKVRGEYFLILMDFTTNKHTFFLDKNMRCSYLRRVLAKLLQMQFIELGFTFCLFSLQELQKFMILKTNNHI